MKTYIKSLVLILIICSSPLFAQTEQQSKKEGPKTKSIKTLKLQITGMTCAHGCAMGIQDAVYKKKGVKSSDVNFDTGIGTFVYDEAKITKEEIIKAITTFNPGESGTMKYTVTEIK
jgi:periplasmic mercuric ion binding protein